MFIGCIESAARALQERMFIQVDSLRFSLAAAVRRCSVSSKHRESIAELPTGESQNVQ